MFVTALHNKSGPSVQLRVNSSSSFLSPVSTLPPVRPKMVDVVSPPRMMPSETEVHVARSFLTRILRSSMRYHTWLW